MNALQSLTGGPAGRPPASTCLPGARARPWAGWAAWAPWASQCHCRGQPPRAPRGWPPTAWPSCPAAPQSEYGWGGGRAASAARGRGRGGGLVPWPGGHAAARAPPPHPPGAAVGSRTGPAPGLGGQGRGAALRSEGREKGCTALLGPWKVGAAPRDAPPQLPRNIPVESPEPPRCRAPAVCTCAALGGLVTCAMESAPPNSASCRPGSALQP